MFMKVIKSKLGAALVIYITFLGMGTFIFLLMGLDLSSGTQPKHWDMLGLVWGLFGVFSLLFIRSFGLLFQLVEIARASIQSGEED